MKQIRSPKRAPRGSDARAAAHALHDPKKVRGGSIEGDRLIVTVEGEDGELEQHVHQIEGDAP